MSTQMLLWIGFNVFVGVMLALDLGVFHRRAHVVKVKEALLWSAAWITLALLFNFGIYCLRGPEIALQFLTGYLIEKSLSVDNLFIFYVIFSHFRVPELYQHKVLFWGILGAIVMRAIMIALGAALISYFHWMIYVFGAILIATAFRLARQRSRDISLEGSVVLRFLTRHMRFLEYRDHHFFVREKGKLFATQLFLVLLTVEFTDLVFAIDSIPAIFAITPDPFIVYTSNIFAILGLRALYFALAGVIKSFHYLKTGLAIVLGFVGVKMILSDYYPIPIGISLVVIASVLALTVAASILFPPKTKHPS